MSSLEILSPEQRIQQLESTLISVLTQVADLTRQLQLSLTEPADLQERVEQMESSGVEAHEEFCHESV